MSSQSSGGNGNEPCTALQTQTPQASWHADSQAREGKRPLAYQSLPTAIDTAGGSLKWLWERSAAWIQPGTEVDLFDHMRANQWIQRIVSHLLEVRRDKYPR